MYWQQKDEDYSFCHIGIEHGKWLCMLTVIIQVTKKQGEVSTVIFVYL